MSIGWDEKRQAIIQWLEKVSGVTAIFEDQDAPRPTPPYITVKIISGPIRVGHDETRVRENNTIVDIVGQRQFTVSVTSIGSDQSEAEKIMNCVQISVCRDEIRQDFIAADLAFQTAEGPFDLSALLDTVTEPRKQMDVIFGTVFSIEEEQGRVEQVEVTGTVNEGPSSTQIIEGV